MSGLEVSVLKILAICNRSMEAGAYHHIFEIGGPGPFGFFSSLLDNRRLALSHTHDTWPQS